MIFLCLLLFVAPPETESKPLVFGFEASISDKAKIYVETLFPKSDKDKWKVLTKEEFRSAAKTIVYHEYRLTKMVIEKDEIVELHFRLPTRDEYRNQESQPNPRRDIAAPSQP